MYLTSLLLALGWSGILLAKALHLTFYCVKWSVVLLSAKVNPLSHYFCSLFTAPTSNVFTLKEEIWNIFQVTIPISLVFAFLAIFICYNAFCTHKCATYQLVLLRYEYILLGVYLWNWISILSVLVDYIYNSFTTNSLCSSLVIIYEYACQTVILLWCLICFGLVLFVRQYQCLEEVMFWNRTISFEHTTQMIQISFVFLFWTTTLLLRNWLLHSMATEVWNWLFLALLFLYQYYLGIKNNRTEMQNWIYKRGYFYIALGYGMANTSLLFCQGIIENSFQK